MSSSTGLILKTPSALINFHDLPWEQNVRPGTTVSDSVSVHYYRQEKIF